MPDNFQILTLVAKQPFDNKTDTKKRRGLA